MKSQLLIILSFLCIQNYGLSISINQKVINDPDSTFLFLIEPYRTIYLPLYCTDIDNTDNMYLSEETNFELRKKYLINISAISKLSKFSVYENGNFVGSNYAMNKLQAFKKTRTSNFILLFYIKAAWDLSRSLVYAVFDSFGNEVYSQVLVSMKMDHSHYNKLTTTSKIR